MRNTFGEVAQTFGRALRLVTFRRVPGGEAGPGLPALAVLLGLFASLLVGFGFLEGWEEFGFNEWGVVTLLASIALFAAVLALSSLRFSRTVLRRAVGDLLAIGNVFGVMEIATFAAGQQSSGWLDFSLPLVHYAWAGLGYAIFAWMLVAIFRAGRHLWDAPVRWAGTRMLSAYLLTFALIPSQPIVYGEYSSWRTGDLWFWSRIAIATYYDPPVEPAAEVRTAYVPPHYDVEDTLFRQQSLLNGTLGALSVSDAVKPQYYFLAAAPNGSQDVFANEVTEARKIFDNRFGTQGHSAVLITSPETLDTVPMATVKNLEVSLQEIGRVMDRKKDVLVLFITSHGAEGVVSVYLRDYPLNQITPDGLAEALDSAGIKNRVLIISACHSGSFIPRLENPNTLIMTAARADRTSFGCGNGRQWTYFGDALFNNALREETDLLKAFDKANALITQWEFWRKMLLQKPSEPQISVGSEIAAVLKTMVTPGTDQRAEADIEPQRK